MNTIWFVAILNSTPWNSHKIVYWKRIFRKWMSNWTTFGHSIDFCCIFDFLCNTIYNNTLICFSKKFVQKRVNRNIHLCRLCSTHQIVIVCDWNRHWGALYLAWWRPYICSFLIIHIGVAWYIRPRGQEELARR